MLSYFPLALLFSAGVSFFFFSLSFQSSQIHDLFRVLLYLLKRKDASLITPEDLCARRELVLTSVWFLGPRHPTGRHEPARVSNCVSDCVSNVIRVLKTTTAFAELNLAVSHSYSAQVVEVQWLQDSALHVLLLLGDRTALAELLAAMGFAWDDSGFEAYWSSFHVFLGAAGTFPRAMRHTMLRLFLYLASEDGALDPADVRTWIPSPEVLDKLDRESWACRAFALNNVLALGARAHSRASIARPAFAPFRRSVLPT